MKRERKEPPSDVLISSLFRPNLYRTRNDDGIYAGASVAQRREVSARSGR